MSNPHLYQLLADTVLVLHTAVALFVVGGLPLIVFGRRWRWVDALSFRLAHLAAVLTIALQSWLGADCPLTSLESWLRTRAGAAAYEVSWVEHWLQQLLFYQAPGWAFTTLYSLFGLLVVLIWLRFPPRRDQRPKR